MPPDAVNELNNKSSIVCFYEIASIATVNTLHKFVNEMEGGALIYKLDVNYGSFSIVIAIYYSQKHEFFVEVY